MVTLHAALVAVALTGAGQSVLLDFYADWCGPCRAMNPTVEALLAQGYPVQRVNIDQNRPLAAKYGVQRIPCFVMLIDGREVDRVTETTTFSRLERMCKLGASAAAAPPSPVMRAQEAAIGGRSRLVQDAPPAPVVIPAGFAVPPAVSMPSAPADWPAGMPAGNQPVSAPAVADATLIAASVRLRVEDPTGRSCGSGTIIDSRGGEALVLTCGHIFRDSQGKGRIEVDLFGTNPPQEIPGRLISYDLTRDIGLVAIRPPLPVATARLAPPGYRVAKGQAVVSVGCNNGGQPTARHSQVTSLNKFQGPPNIEVAGQPVEGRSGGGLFSGEGYVIGVCNAADPSDQEGLFAALGTISAQLDQDQLAFVYKSPANSAAGASEGSNLAGIPPVTPPAVAPEAGLASHEQAALDEIRRSLKGGAEVVVVVRPRGNPDAQSEVIMLDHASPEFLKQLAAEQSPHGPPYATAFKPHKKWLEWSAPEGAAASNALPAGAR
jgi:thiol-disulfide isomerase/thioredoxin